MHNLDSDVVIITENNSKELCLQILDRCQLSADSSIIIAGMEHENVYDPRLRDSINNLIVPSYAGGYRYTLRHIFECLNAMKNSGLNGAIAEFGMCKGGTTLLIVDLVKKLNFEDVKIFGFDIFDKFPESKSTFDLFANSDYEFKNHKEVISLCEQKGITVVHGDICKTFTALEGIPLMMVFFDTDNYSPAKAALPLCYENMLPGGIFIFDHFLTQEGCLNTIGERMAAREFFADKNDILNLSGTGVFIKMPKYS